MYCNWAEINLSKSYIFSASEYIPKEIDISRVNLWQVSLAVLVEKLIQLNLGLELLQQVMDIDIL
jgi:hypothetical protein